MKTRIILLFSIATTIMSCNKDNYDPADFIPSVEMISATPNSEGTIDVVARIINVGEGELQLLGFCADSSADPNIEVNQVLVSSLNYNEFQATIYPFAIQSKDNRIFINAFAGNEVGLGKAIALELSDLDMSYPYPKIRTSCDLEDGAFNIGDFGNGQFTSVSLPIRPPGSIAYRVTASSQQGVTAEIYFNELTTGIYQTVLSTTNNYAQDEMALDLTYNGETKSLRGEYEIVVNQIGPNQYKLSFCDSFLATVGSTTFECELVVEY